MLRNVIIDYLKHYSQCDAVQDIRFVQGSILCKNADFVQENKDFVQDSAIMETYKYLGLQVGAGNKCVSVRSQMELALSEFGCGTTKTTTTSIYSKDSPCPQIYLSACLGANQCRSFEEP